MENGGVVAFESGVPAEVQRELIRKGHKLQVVLGSFGGYQAILYDAKNDVYRAASESRKDGMAAGYVAVAVAVAAKPLAGRIANRPLLFLHLHL
jgi:hypothetical protein